MLQRFYHPTKKELSSLCSVLGHVGQSAAVVVCADLLFLLSLPYPWLFLVLVVGLLDMAQCHFRPVYAMSRHGAGRSFASDFTVGSCLCARDILHLLPCARSTGLEMVSAWRRASDSDSFAQAVCHVVSHGSVRCVITIRFCLSHAACDVRILEPWIRRESRNQIVQLSARHSVPTNTLLDSVPIDPVENVRI